MPHYVTLDYTTENPENPQKQRYFIYSTIIDGNLTGAMNADRMRMWLWETAGTPNDYTKSWCDPRPPMDDPELVTLYQLSPEYIAKCAECYYWEPRGKFWYVKETDNWFVLPRESWRNGE